MTTVEAKICPPDRGALDAKEKTVSVRWDAAPSSIRGPYYTGEKNRDGLAMYDLVFDNTTQSAQVASSAGPTRTSGAPQEQTRKKRLFNAVPMTTSLED